MIRATIATLTLILAACGTVEPEPATEAKPKADKPEGNAAIVAKRYDECLTRLDASPPKNDTSQFVTAKVPDGELTFRIKKAGDKTFTFPFDEFTVDQLTSVDC
jgi:hypothetical protein